MAQKKQQLQTQPVTPAKQQKDTSVTELTDKALEQVVGGLTSSPSLGDGRPIAKAISY